jgi:hypothetical protein
MITVMGGGIGIIFLSLAAGILIVFFCYIFWIVTTLVLYAISSIFKGTGLLVKTAQNIGYGEAFCLAATGGFLLVSAVIAAIFNVSLRMYGETARNNSLSHGL